jgi:hypothetical protein
MTKLFIEKFLNVDEISENLLPSFIKEVENKKDPLDEDAIEFYTEQLKELLSGKDITTNDKTLGELFGIFYDCLTPIDGTNTVRFVCNNLVSDIQVVYSS